jgi:hypothetical protein
MHLDNIIYLRNNNVYLQKQAKTTYELERSSIYDGYLIVRAICVVHGFVWNTYQEPLQLIHLS